LPYAKLIPIFLWALFVVALGGCAAMATQGLAHDLGLAILNQDDPATVRAGAPAYLLLLDGLIQNSPNDETLLMAGAKLYGAYSTVFVEENQRARRLSQKAKDYGRRAMCLRQPAVCTVDGQPYEQFSQVAATIPARDLPELYTYATAWASWIQARSDDWGALADVPKVQVLLERVVALDDGFESGQAHVYLGVIDTRLPASLGGKPEEGRAHFEKAIALSKGRNLVAQVEYARRYARLVFDRKLHDRLLEEVVAADPEEPGLTLSNTLAQEQARELLATADEYF
jgi:phage anti-repressor protein